VKRLKALREEREGLHRRNAIERLKALRKRRTRP